jgi:hypothetical protein
MSFGSREVPTELQSKSETDNQSMRAAFELDNGFSE